MKKKTLLLAAIIFVSLSSHGQSGMTKIATSNTVEATVKKLTNVLNSKGLHVFSVIDHKKGAESASMELRPTTVIIFGNPAVGTKLMNCDQSIGIDLPMKFLVWQDKEGKNWVGYYKPSMFANKYDLELCQAVLEKMDGALAKFASLGTE
ncbi:MAG: DUF302 domain-containing protein [Cyclobacteriaceae bacterium]|nr:DUF302 domain-containing protein [Cyclobacteriaceae bacterium]